MSAGSKQFIFPFAAMRPTSEQAAAVIAPPYDVMNVEQARLMAKKRPWSFLHVSRAEIDLPDGCDPYSAAVYSRSAINWQIMLDEKVLVQEQQPALYIYRLSDGESEQTGIGAVVSIEAYAQGRVKRHELTKVDKEDDRVKQIEALHAQTGPVLLAHKPDSDLKQLVVAMTGQAPDVEVKDDDDVTHSLWVIENPQQLARLEQACNQLESLYIADGHHRSAAAARVATDSTTDSGNRFLSVLFPADEMQILAYNRLIYDLGELSVVAFLEAVSAVMSVAKTEAPVLPAQVGEFGLYIDAHWYRLQCRADSLAPGDLVGDLDVSLLTNLLLAPILGISDLRNDARVGFIGGIHGPEILQQRVDSGTAVAAITVHATNMEELFKVADAGLEMPPKSTWFEPKLVDGLLSHVID